MVETQVHQVNLPVSASYSHNVYHRTLLKALDRGITLQLELEDHLVFDDVPELETVFSVTTTEQNLVNIGDWMDHEGEVLIERVVSGFSILNIEDHEFTFFS